MINILWMLFEIAVNIYQGFMAVYFVYAFLGGKGIKSFLTPINIVFSFVYATAICLENFIFGDAFALPAYFFAAVYFTILFLYSKFAFNSFNFKGLFAATTSNVIVLLSVTLCSNIAAILFGDQLGYLMTHPCLERALAIICSQLLSVYLMFIIIRFLSKSNLNDTNSFFEWGIVSTVLIISLIIGAYINYVVVGSHNKLGLFSIIVFMCIVITNILVCWLLFDLVKKNKDINELNLLRQTQEYNRQYIENLQAEYETVRKLRHDYKNSFMLLSALLENGDPEKAKEEISKIVGEIASTEIFINTDNAVVNAVVNSKLSAAKALGIECECYVIKEISGIDDISLCRLLSNMLDNAVAACKKEYDGKRVLELSIMANKISYTFTVKNKISESVIERNPELKSTTKDIRNHGYGVKIIREIAEKYGGRSYFYEEEGMFCCVVCLRRNDSI